MDAKVSGPLAELVNDSLANNVKREERIVINRKTYLFIIFPIKESGYANVYGVDVTEEEKAHKELEISERKYRTLLQAIPSICVS